MSLKKITPKESAFKYNPKVNEIYLISDLKFDLNKDSLKFELDQNPHGEPMLTAIESMEANEDFSEVKFHANYRGESVDFQVTNATAYDASIYRIIHSVNEGEMVPKYNPEDLDKVDIIFNEGQLFQRYLYKYQEYDLLDTFTVIREENELYLIIQEPWKKVKVQSLSVDSGSIICKTSEEEVAYTLDVNDFILRIVKELFSKM